MKKATLVVGGAGYIGAQMAKVLDRAGHEIIVLDNLSTGHCNAVKYGEFVEGNFGDRGLLKKLFESGRIGAVMCFAAYCSVEESNREPIRWYKNNVAETLTLLESMLRHEVRNLIFSSTAAVYGQPAYVPVDEAHPVAPVNPYGASKAMVERMLADLWTAYGLRSVSLRYFNAAGADPEGELGERHEPETHLVSNVLQAASGRKREVIVYGRDYPPPDRTCIRDYIHVWDLCQAHLRALEYLVAGGESTTLNLGNGAGYSVQQVLGAVIKLTNHHIEIREAPMRLGDPARLVADASLARKVLGWTPKYNLEEIIRHA